MRQSVGKHHPLMGRLRALRRDARRRTEESVFVAEGLHLARETLSSQLAIEQIVVSSRIDESEEGRALIAAIAERGLECVEVTQAVMETLQDARSAQPVTMIVRRPDLSASERRSDGDPLIVVACGIQDPGNLGGLFRTAEAAGAIRCCLTGQSADPFHPRAVRASAGSILRLPVVSRELAELFDELESAGIRTSAADAAAGVPYDRADLSGPTAIFFGAEGAGLPPEARERCNQGIRVPHEPAVESLSVTAAAAIVLFEARRQRAASRRAD